MRFMPRCKSCRAVPGWAVSVPGPAVKKWFWMLVGGCRNILMLYICMYIHMYVYIYIYVYIYTIAYIT